MVKFSRFTHIYDLGDVIALYHSLRMKPVYISLDTYKNLQEWIASSFCDNVFDAPNTIKKEVQVLLKFKILIQNENEDDNVLQFVKSKIPTPATSICYMILSEQCNLACKYCFLGNNNINNRKKFLVDNMTKEIADKAISFFIRQIKESEFDYEMNNPVMIFYGGEPLINFPILEYIANKINEMRGSEKCIKNIELSVITNGLLLDQEKIKKLNNLKVAICISIDGFSEESNKMRVDTAGQSVYHKIIEKLDLCKKMNIPISLSVTINEETLKDHRIVNKLLDEYKIKSFGFNILMSSDAFVIPRTYNEKAADYIIEEFIECRGKGIYEDRIMRKLKAFSNAQLYFSDCGATSGSQIVIAPNGEVGICHGCLQDKKYFVATVDDSDFIAAKNKTFIEWSNIIPLNNEKCYNCSSLGICGGGCPLNAMQSKKGNTLHSIDERFCVHSKKTLEFFIRDLYRVIKLQRGANEK